MVQSTSRSAGDQAGAVRNQFDEQSGLPFLEVLSASEVESACRAWNHRWRNRIYTPWITLGMFLSQILSSDHSCGDALERFQKYRKDCGLPPVANDTASYCEARQRLPEEVVWELARRSGQSIHEQGRRSLAVCQGRPVKLLDGSTVIMPDTEANQAEYPQSRSQKPGLGFPIARILLIISLAVGTVLEAAMGPYQGKQSSELGLFRQISGQLQPGDIALADRFFCNYWVIADSQRRGVDVVFRLHQTRKADFRRGRRLGPDDHIVTWPKSQRPDWMSPAEYAAMPKELRLREIRVRIKDRTKRTRELVIVTTLLDATKYSASALGDLFRQRWHAELDIRSLESDHDHRQRSDHDNRCSISPWEYRSVPHLRMGNGTIFSDPQQRRCQPADVRPIWPACSSDSSTSPNRSFLTASESRSVVRVSARPRASSASTRSVRLSSFSS